MCSKELSDAMKRFVGDDSVMVHDVPALLIFDFRFWIFDSVFSIRDCGSVPDLRPATSAADRPPFVLRMGSCYQVFRSRTTFLRYIQGLLRRAEKEAKRACVQRSNCAARPACTPPRIADAGSRLARSIQS